MGGGLFRPSGPRKEPQRKYSTSIDLHNVLPGPTTRSGDGSGSLCPMSLSAGGGLANCGLNGINFGQNTRGTRELGENASFKDTLISQTSYDSGSELKDESEVYDWLNERSLVTRSATHSVFSREQGANHSDEMSNVVYASGVTYLSNAANPQYIAPPAITETTKKVKCRRDRRGVTYINQYKIVKHLGSGSSGKVKMCEDRQGRKWAIKILARPNRSIIDGAQVDVEKTCEFLKTLNHHNLVNLYEVLADPDSDKYFLVYEYVNGGSLMPESNIEVKAMDTKRAWRILRGTLLGLSYLHSKHIIHGDIKPSNILEDKDGNIKISDFGLSKVINKDDKSDLGARSEKIHGTPIFMSPELWDSQKHPGFPADIWALGVFLYYLLFGKPPFMGENKIELMNAIRKNIFVPPRGIDPTLADLLVGLLRKNPQDRLTMPELIRMILVKSRLSAWLERARQKISLRRPYQTIHPDLRRSVLRANAEEATISNKQDRLLTNKKKVNSVVDAIRRSIASSRCSIDTSSSVLSGPNQVPTTPISRSPRESGCSQRDLAVQRQTRSKRSSVLNSINDRMRSFAVLQGKADVPVDPELAKHPSWYNLSPLLSGTSTPKGESAPRVSKDDGELNVMSSCLPTLILRRTSALKMAPQSDSESEGEEDAVEFNFDEFAQLIREEESYQGPITRSVKVDPKFHSPLLNIKVGIMSSKGVSEVNEDRLTVIMDYNYYTKQISVEHALFDGHSGSGCSEFLAKQFHLFLMQQESFMKDPKQSLLSAFDMTDHAYLEYAKGSTDMGRYHEAAQLKDLLSADFSFVSDPAIDYSGSTAAVALLRQSVLYVAHVGDSRVVLCRDGDAVDLTKDHKPYVPEERLMIESRGGWVTNNRLNGILAVSRAFGDIEYKIFKEKAWRRKFGGNPLSVEPDVIEEIIRPEDVFFVIGSDGLFDVFSSQEAVNFVLKTVALNDDLNYATQELVNEAIRLGTNDNVTAIIVYFERD